MTDRASLDETALAELQDVMEDEFGILVETFLTDSRARLDTLRELLSQGDAEQLAKAAHSFKGSCINMGAQRLSGLCAQAELAGRSRDFAAVLTLLDRMEAEFAEVGRLLERF